MADTSVFLFLNVKCDPLLIGSLRQKPGSFPAYHMSKTQWITAVLDAGRAGDHDIVSDDIVYIISDFYVIQH